MNIPVSESLVNHDSTHTVTLRLGPEHMAWLQRRAEALDVSVNQLVRYVINRWMQAEGQVVSAAEDDGVAHRKERPQGTQGSRKTSRSQRDEDGQPESEGESVLSILRDRVEDLKALEEKADAIPKRKPPKPPSADGATHSATPHERNSAPRSVGERESDASSNASLFEIAQRANNKATDGG